jgi:hypothetical protein
LAGKPRSRTMPWRLVAAAGGAALGAVALWIFAQQIVLSLGYADSDFFTFWLGGRFILDHIDPYNSAAWIQGHYQYGAEWVSDPAYIYPLPLAVLMAPLGRMNLLLAYQTWMFLSVLMIVAAVWLASGLRFSKRDAPFAVPWILGAFLFRPAIVILRNGQLGALLLIVLALGCVLAVSNRSVAAGAVFGLLCLKPSLGFPILGLLGLWILAGRRWRLLTGLVACVTGLVALGWAVEPAWIGHLSQWGPPKLMFNMGFFPSAWGLGTALCGARSVCAWGVGGALAGAGVLTVVWLILRRRASMTAWEAASLAVPAALFAAPYIGAYDLVLLLLPIAYSLQRLRRSGLPYLLVGSLTFWIDLIALLLVLVAARIGLDLWSSLLDMLVLGLVIASLRFGPQEAARAPSLA